MTHGFGTNLLQMPEIKSGNKEGNQSLHCNRRRERPEFGPARDTCKGNCLNKMWQQCGWQRMCCQICTNSAGNFNSCPWEGLGCQVWKLTSLTEGTATFQASIESPSKERAALEPKTERTIFLNRLPNPSCWKIFQHSWCYCCQTGLLWGSANADHIATISCMFICCTA